MGENTETKTDLQRFFEYVQAFELAHATDDWGSLAPSFAPDACHVVHDGGPLGGVDRGRDAVLAGQRDSVHVADRRFTTRIPEIVEGPAVRPDGIWMRFVLELRHEGVPPLRIEGEHRMAFRDGLVVEIEERLAPGTGARAAAFLAEHGARLRPAGAPPAFPASPLDRRDGEAALYRSLVRCYAGAKSVADVGAALTVCSPDFTLETVPFGITSHDRAETARHLPLFFQAFPDYRVSLEGMTVGEGVATCWGTARMTLAGDLLGHPATGRAAALPVFCVFTMGDAAVRGERFFFDLATLCDQIGVPIAEMQASLAPFRQVDGPGAAAAAS